MASNITIDELVTKLSYQADTGPLRAADQGVTALDKANKNAAASVDKLSGKLETLTDNLEDTKDRTLALKEQQLRLQRQIDATGKPTAEQRKEMYRLKAEIQDNEMHAKKLAAAQRELQRELKQTKEDAKRLADEQKRVAKEAEKAERTKQREAKETERAQAKQERARAREAQREERTRVREIKESEREKKRMADKAAAAQDKLATPGSMMEDALEGTTGISLSGMTGSAMALTGAVAGVAALAAGMAMLGAKVYETSAHFQTLRASLITVTGSATAADKQFAAIREFARDTPYQVDAATQAFVKLKALGLDASSTALKSYGNTASALGKELNDMIEAVADATTGEFERLKEFGIKSKTVGDNVQFTFRGVTKTVKKEAEAIQEYLLKVGNTEFAGAMERQMQTIGGAVSNLEDTWDAFLLKIGEGGQMEGLAEIVQKLSSLMTDDLAGALGELQKEGTGVLDDLVSSFDASDLTGIVQGLVVVVKVLRTGLQPVIFLLGKIFDILAAIGRVLDLLSDVDLGKLLEEFEGLSGAIDGIKDAIDFVDEKLGTLGERIKSQMDAKDLGTWGEKVVGVYDAVGEKFGELWDQIDQQEHATEMLAQGWDSVTEALTGVSNSAEQAKGALLSLLSKELSDQIQQVANQLELGGQKAIQGATEAQLQRMRASGGVSGKLADKELIRRATVAKTEREDKLFTLGGGEKFKTDTLTKAKGAIEDAAGAKADETFRAARDAGASKDDAQRTATIAKGAEIERLTAIYDATGQYPPKKKKGKKGKAEKIHGLDKLVRKQIDELSEQAGEREGARLVAAINKGEVPTIDGKPIRTIDDAIEAGEEKRIETRDKMLDDFYATGKLPPGIRSDLQRLTQIPSVEQQIGKVAPPVIAVNNFRVDASIGELHVGEGGTFAGSPAEIGMELQRAVKMELSSQLRTALTDITQGEMP